MNAEGKNFKTSLEEIYSVTLALFWKVITYLLKNVENGFEHNVNSACGV